MQVHGSRFAVQGIGLRVTGCTVQAISLRQKREFATRLSKKRLMLKVEGFRFRV